MRISKDPDSIVSISVLPEDVSSTAMPDNCLEVCQSSMPTMLSQYTGTWRDFIATPLRQLSTSTERSRSGCMLATIICQQQGAATIRIIVRSLSIPYFTFSPMIQADSTTRTPRTLCRSTSTCLLTMTCDGFGVWKALAYGRNVAITSDLICVYTK
jgi:hypothetical protein